MTDLIKYIQEGNNKLNTKTSIKIIEQCENSLANDKLHEEEYFKFLNFSRKPKFLEILKTTENRNKWSELVFKIIQKYEFSLLNLIEQRVIEHPDKTLFKDRSSARNTEWTYKQVFHYMKGIAAFIYSVKPKKPKVALYINNSIDGAITDLACLSYDIFNTPLNIHFNETILEYIFNKLEIDIVITDTPERLKIVKSAVSKIKKDIKIVVTKENSDKNKIADYYLNNESKKITLNDAKQILEKREIKPINQVATTMFTSGSTGMPKGVSFSNYNIVSKRFARAAALPQVGKEEVLISYLPLFHTFGRYLELTGTIFWGGTYIFAGNSSSATLLSLFPKENPTGFISVPIRWVQIYDKCIKATEGINDEKEQIKIIKTITGKNLHWGLSAAGYLDPKIFRYFHKFGITVNSGFGMTEATGGITMTPSFEYRENSTGIPLPGTETRLKETGELEIKGHYIAKYLEDAGPEDIIEFPHKEDYWLSTGDIFKIDETGHHEIIDRVKDIYKNNKGQTVAPGMIEKKFSSVPGIKHAFLVGDARPYNVLLIAPDKEDPIFKLSDTDENMNKYFHQIVMTANKDLAPYERVINFRIIDRDFTKEKDELTQKGSFKRKNIQSNFTNLISELYKKNYITFKKKGFEIIIPRWFFRDIGILETDIISSQTGIYNKETKQGLRIEKSYKEDVYLIGDLNYKIYEKRIDLGIIVRQPKLWAGNPELIGFSPVKESFDFPLKNISPQLCVPTNDINTYNPGNIHQPKGINDADLFFLNALLSEALHTEKETALKNLRQIENIFSGLDRNKAELVRRRLEALACHKNEDVRISAYRILLTKDPEPDFSELLPAFINSGNTFLNESSINLLAKNSTTFEHFNSLRKRLYLYRTELKWPANKQTSKQFITIFKLLLNYGINHPKYYKSIRAEFASWMLLKDDPSLSRIAAKYFNELYEGFIAHIKKTTEKYTEKQWKKFLIFDEGISEENKNELITKLAASHTLKQAIILVYEEYTFDMKQITENSIWVSRIKSFRNTKHYRLSISTLKDKHYDLHISIDNKLKTKEGLETIYKMIELGNYPFEHSSITDFGCSNPNDKILISAYLSMLTAWDKIRAIAEVQASGNVEQANIWRKIYIRAMSAFFKVWDHSKREIIPGFVAAGNVALPENDFSNNAVVISLSGWKPNGTFKKLVTAMLQNFYNKTKAHYPIAKKYIKSRWIFHACVEAIGKEDALILFNELKNSLEEQKELSLIEVELLQTVTNYIKDFVGRTYLPLPLFNAIDRYNDWSNKNPQAKLPAKEQTILELFDLYGLDKYTEIVRYKFFKETFFKDSNSEILSTFEILLNKMADNFNIHPLQLTELSDLQSKLENESEKNMFGKMVFPGIKKKQKVDILTRGKKKDEHVIIRSILKDKNKTEYTMREPLEAFETGELYKLFYKEKYPKKISNSDKHYILTDINERVIGGLCYKNLGDGIVLIDGMAVTSPLHGKGIGSAMMEDFFTRIKAQGIKTIKAHFLFGNYYLKHNFVIDKKWGALVKEL